MKNHCQTHRKSIRTAVPGIRPFLVALAVPLVVAACQSGPPALSLEEAKQLTASFEGGLIPPLRTIKDIERYLPQPVEPPTKFLASRCQGEEWEASTVAKFKKLSKQYGPLEKVDSDDSEVRG